MSTTYKYRFFNEDKQNDIKFNKVGQTRMLVICLNYEGTQNPLNCIIDGQRIIKEAKKSGVTDILALFDDGSTDIFPTKYNVIKAMKKMASKCQVGDYLVVQFSGHGSKDQDQNGDQEDGRDEAFCLMNEKRKIQYLIDDDAALIITQALHPLVPCLFIVDACCSGSILDLSKDSVWSSANVFSISGCQDNQCSKDTRNGGQMTNILLEVISNTKNLRQRNSASIQYIFNRMITLNQQKQVNYQKRAIKDYKFNNNNGSNYFILKMIKMCYNSRSVSRKAMHQMKTLVLLFPFQKSLKCVLVVIQYVKIKINRKKKLDGFNFRVFWFQ